ncbi:hypothetical protein AOLI_G00125740 [Acnodon oligacanthus]
MLLLAVAKSLGMRGPPEALPLRTVSQDIQVLHGHTLSFSVSPVANPQTGYEIKGAFTAGRLTLAQHTYPIERLQRKFRLLRGLPIPSLQDAKPSLLIGSDQPHLITPVESVRLGPRGGPAAVHTRLGWTLQGPIRDLGHPIHPTQCLHVSSPLPTDDIYSHVERLWQIDTVPQRHDREVTMSKQDQQAVMMLEAKTVRIEVDGILRYATPLLRHVNMPLLHAPRESVMRMLRSSERHLLKDPTRAEAYKNEMQKLIESGAVREVTQDVTLKEEWFLWRDLRVDEPPRTFEWQVLPFGTTCSPCCATCVLQHHVVTHSQPDDILWFTVKNCFYVDNCLRSVRTPSEAKIMVDQLRDLMASAGFELRQWACNDPSLLSHLPQEARSESLDLWLAQDKSNPL